MVVNGAAANGHTHAVFPTSYTTLPVIVGDYYSVSAWVVPSGCNVPAIVFPTITDFYFGSQGGNYWFISIGY